MSDERDQLPEDTNPSLGMSRRDFVRRSAVVGGTLLWATPVVQSIPRAAFAGDGGTPAPSGISFVALLIDCGGTVSRAKYEVGAGAFVETSGKNCEPCEPDGGDSDCVTVGSDTCCQPDGYASAPEASADLSDDITVTPSGDQLCFTAPAGCTFVDGRGKGGDTDTCFTGTGEGTSTICFTDPTA